MTRNEIVENNLTHTAPVPRKLKAVWSMEADQDLRSSLNALANSQIMSQIMAEYNGEEATIEIPRKKPRFRSLDDEWDA